MRPTPLDRKAVVIKEMSWSEVKKLGREKVEELLKACPEVKVTSDGEVIAILKKYEKPKEFAFSIKG